MELKKSQGFTLIELMIVLAIIGVLSVVIIPKVTPLKNQAKNNEVQSNIYIVRSFLENRSGADRINIMTSLGIKTDQASIITALDPIKTDINQKINITFSGSNEIKNPFNNKTAVTYFDPSILNSAEETSSIVVGYNTSIMPTDVSAITSTVSTPGVIAIIVYQTGYVVYGVDNFGKIIAPTLINMPNTVAQSPAITNPQPPNKSILPNITTVVDYLEGKVIEDIVVANRNSAAMSSYRYPLMVTDLGLTALANQIINPYGTTFTSYNDKTVIGNYTTIGNSILVEKDYSSTNLTYSDYKGFVVVDFLADGNGYSVYGIDSDGNKVTTPSTTITGITATVEADAILKSNLNTLKASLIDRVGFDVSTIRDDTSVDKTKAADILIKDLYAGGHGLKSFQATLSPKIIYNADNSHWSQISSPEIISLNETGYSIILSSLITRNIDDYSNYRGAIVISVNYTINTADNNNDVILGYKIYGIKPDGTHSITYNIDINGAVTTIP